MSKERCEDCRYWSEADEEAPLEVPEAVESYCRRFPPSLVADQDDSAFRCVGFTHPVVMHDHWCGEFKAREQGAPRTIRIHVTRGETESIAADEVRHWTSEDERTRSELAAKAPPPPQWWFDAQRSLEDAAKSLATWSYAYADAMMKARDA